MSDYTDVDRARQWEKHANELAGRNAFHWERYACLRAAVERLAEQYEQYGVTYATDLRAMLEHDDAHANDSSQPTEASDGKGSSVASPSVTE